MRKPSQSGPLFFRASVNREEIIELSSLEHFTQIDNSISKLPLSIRLRNGYGFALNERIVFNDYPVLPREGHCSQRIISIPAFEGAQNDQRAYFVAVSREREGARTDSWLNLSYLIISGDDQLYPDDFRRLMCSFFPSFICRLDFLRGKSLLTTDKTKEMIIRRYPHTDLNTRQVVEVDLEAKTNLVLSQKPMFPNMAEPFASFSDALSFCSSRQIFGRELKLSPNENKKFGYLITLLGIIKLIKGVNTDFDRYYSLKLSRNPVWNDQRICVRYDQTKSLIEIEIGQYLSDFLFESMGISDIISMLEHSFIGQREVLRSQVPQIIYDYYDEKLKDLAKMKLYDESLGYLYSTL